MFAKLRHWLFPHHTNNFRARLLHNAGLTVLIAAFLTFSTVTRLLESSALHILGFSSSITVDEVVQQTNEQRLSHGLQPLAFSTKLSQAAAGKAADMFGNNYWAHNSPAGKTPWDFILGAGYDYSFAGENLAKDFSNTSRMMSAWMTSPTHRANIVSDKYSQIGIAVVPGSLNGQETVLVVQMFGQPSTVVGSVPADTPASQSPVEAIAGQETEATVPTIAQIDAEPEEIPAPTPAIIIQEPAPYNDFNFKRAGSITTTVFLILVLLFDLIIAESKRLSRRVGKNWAHLVFINVILILITFINAGNIL